MPVFFSKYTGAGNDFILIDNRDSRFDLQKLSPIIPHLCHRQKGLGADGVIFLCSSKNADYAMRIFNCDGSEAEMCGNGLRCLGKFIQHLGESKKNVLVETPLSPNKVHRLLLENECVTIEMDPPQEERSVFLEDYNMEVDFLDSGVPHAVLFVSDIEKIDVPFLGKNIRSHPAFGPRGTNVNFASLSSNIIYLRTYERGVEAETLACGTGAVAAGYVAIKKLKITSPVSIIVRSKDRLEINLKKDHENEGFSKILMTGPAKRLFQGNFMMEDFLTNA